MGKRRSSRELVIKFLYLVEMNEGDADAQRLEFWERNPCQPDIQGFADEILDNIFQHRNDIDSCVERFSENWTMSRMAVIDRNVLRLATSEILYGKTVPPKVVIDEAVEIAKKFGSGDSPQFINGILDRILRENPTDLKPISKS